MRISLSMTPEDPRELTEAAFSAGHHDVVTAASAWEAMKILDVGRITEEPSTIDVVLLDIIMPEIDGIEACARIRTDPRYADIPIVMVTSLADMDSLANAFVAGATDYITKPINRVELVARVRSALKLKAELDRRQAREHELLSFLSNWGDRRATTWIDEATGLFVGEVAEAYLTATTKQLSDDTVSILALSLDHFEAYQAATGTDAAQSVLSQIANAIRRVGATIGIIAAVYRNGTFVVVAPECSANSARTLGETLCSTIAKLRLPNSESCVGSCHRERRRDYRTSPHGANRVHLLTPAISKVQRSRPRVAPRSRSV